MKARRAAETVLLLQLTIKREAVAVVVLLVEATLLPGQPCLLEGFILLSRLTPPYLCAGVSKGIVLILIILIFHS